MIRFGRLFGAASVAAGAPRDGWLLARMLAWRAVLPLMKHRVRIATLARVMWREPGARARRDHAERIVDFAQRLYWGHRAGKGDICLERSLLAYRYLSSAGMDPQLVVGIRRPGSSVIGHAWVVVEGEPLFESAASVGEYASFFAFGRRGALQGAPADKVRAGDVVAG